MNKNYLVVLLTVLTLSIFTLVIIELTGITRNSLTLLLHGHREGTPYNGTFYSKEGETFHGEIYHEDVRNRDQTVRTMPKTSMQFYETKYDFGSIPAGKVVSHTFRYKNTGSNPLMISRADVTCGCTVPSYQLEVTNPGSDGELTVEYNSTGKAGIQQKNVIVHANTIPEAVSINIEADVK